MHMVAYRGASQAIMEFLILKNFPMNLLDGKNFTPVMLAYESMVGTYSHWRSTPLLSHLEVVSIFIESNEKIMLIE